MEAVRDEAESYRARFAELDESLGVPQPPWLRKARAAAMESFSELGFPTRKNEEWKYTEVAPIRKALFTPPPPPNGMTRDRLEELALLGPESCRVVFLDGHYSAQLSSLGQLPEGVTIGSLGDALGGQPELIEAHLGRYAGFEKHAFVALNTAFIREGAFIHVPEGKALDQPIHVMYLSTGQEATIAHPRNLIVLDRNSQAAILESYVGLGEASYFTNLVTEIVAAENAVVDHYKLHQESRSAFHISTLQIYQQRSSNVRAFNVTVGGALSRNEVNAVLDGEGAHCALDGLYVITGRQHLDNHTRIEHAQPHCDSREIYKGILDEKASGVFHGRIVVHPGAQRTDSKQTNNNLLLSDEALINTKPQLEIYADDVKCTHGATIGQLDEDALFYLRSRGIDRDTARSLLIYAFASEVIDRVKVKAVRAELDSYLFSWLPKGYRVKEAV